MTDRIAALAEALTFYPEDGIEPLGSIRRRWWRLGFLSALAIARDRVAALPPDWCGHAYILDANNADIRDRDQLLRNMRDTIKGHRVCEENMDAEIARLRKIEEAARDIVSLRHGSTYHDVGSIIDALRAALEADHA